MRDRSSPGIPLSVAETLEIHDPVELHGGGSPARTYAAVGPEGRRIVVKVLHDSPRHVDGHDLVSFVTKPAQIEAVVRRLPKLRAHYLPTLGVWRGTDWAAYATPYFEGHPVVSGLQAGTGGLSCLRDELRRPLDVIVREGYLPTAEAAPGDLLASTHVGRIFRRLGLLESVVGEDVLRADRLVVNGRECVSALEIAGRVLRDERAARLFAPAIVSAPIHGDLNLSNLLIGERDEFVLIDPRGTLERWDPVYDFAKGLFSLTAFSCAIAGGLSIVRRQSDGSDGFDVRLRSPAASLHAEAAQIFVELLEETVSTSFDHLDPLWRHRLVLTHALHYLAEASCRISDWTFRDYGHGPDAARKELATGLWLLGTLLLNECWDQREDDVATSGRLTAAATWAEP